VPLVYKGDFVISQCSVEEHTGFSHFTEKVWKRGKSYNRSHWFWDNWTRYL